MWLVNSNESTVLKRHSIPNGWDHAPYKTQCHVVRLDGSYDVYMQNSRRVDAPEWIFVEHITKNTA